MNADPHSTPDDSFGMTDLEERLRGEGGGEVRAAILSRLAQLDRDIRAMTARGLTQQEFRRAQAISGAVTAARELLTRRR